MKQIVIILCLLAAAFDVCGQELTVKSMEVAGFDLSASVHQRLDRNGNPCALVKVMLPVSGAQFEGNVLGEVENKSGEYWVYMSEGTKELRVKHPDYVAVHVYFNDYDIKSLKGKTTYMLTIVGTGNEVTYQTLTVSYAPANAIVMIGDSLCEGNGLIELELPVGEYRYLIASQGYVTAEGTVKLVPEAAGEVNVSLRQKATAAQQQARSHGALRERIETIECNGVSFRMIRVEGGSFVMGGTPNQGEDVLKNELPIHRVVLTTYYMGETEVTQELWEAVMGKNPSKFKGKNRPVERVSWKDCVEFINKLNVLTGRMFRLPTEAEWEYAARGGIVSNEYKYSGANKLDGVAWYKENSGGETHDVKQMIGNELGLYDMSGNVWEWCEDLYDKYTQTFQTNPTGALESSYRVNRGGGWLGEAKDHRVSARFRIEPNRKLPTLGLRLAL